MKTRAIPGPLTLLISAFVALLLSACATVPGRGELPVLPPLSTLGCCWQAQEQVVLRHDSRHQSLLAAIEVTPEHLTMVVLDATGYRLLTLRYDDHNGLQQLNAPPHWDTLYSQYLLCAVFLHRLPPGSWRPENTHWQVESHNTGTTMQKALTQTTAHGQARELISLTYTDPENLEAGHRTLAIPGADIDITITTLDRIDL